MNKKLFLPLIIGAGLIAYFLMKKKKTDTNNVVSSGGPRQQSTPVAVIDRNDLSTGTKQSVQNTAG